MLSLPRRCLRFYVFIVIFVCSLAAFTLPSIIQPISRPAHTFRPDGLLQVNSAGRHPILHLITRAEQEWNAKLSRASQSLPDAVREYHRRYARAPPRGFDRWWAYITKYNVQLPDEYDQIHRDLAPFWAINPAKLQAIQRNLENRRNSYTIAKSSASGHLHVANKALPDDQSEKFLAGAYEIFDLMTEVEQDLPQFRAVFNPDDKPTVFITEDVRRNVLAAAEAGEYIDIDQPVPHAQGWLRACPLHSLAHHPPPPTAPKPKTFIYDHRLAMDPCNHPYLFSNHGQFLSFDEGPGSSPFPVPQFSYCSTTVHSDIRTAMPWAWVEDVEGEDLDQGQWERKEDDRLLWRGTNTGIYHSNILSWKDTQRNRLMEFAQKSSGNVEVLETDEEGDGEGLRTEAMKKARLSHAMLDIAFVGNPTQCDPEVCRELEEMFDWRRRMDIAHAGRYKYVMDVDGNGWSNRFKRLMTTNSLVFKSTIYPEWFTDRIAPWIHYVPVQVDYSDLYDSLVFFRGNLAGRGAHEELGAKIARDGREWSKAFWRREDMVAYMYRLFLEYARVMSEDRDSLNFELED